MINTLLFRFFSAIRENDILKKLNLTMYVSDLSYDPEKKYDIGSCSRTFFWQNAQNLEPRGARAYWNAETANS